MNSAKEKKQKQKRGKAPLISIKHGNGFKICRVVKMEGPPQMEDLHFSLLHHLYNKVKKATPAETKQTCEHSAGDDNIFNSVFFEDKSKFETCR